jgi:hypothetical protein
MTTLFFIILGTIGLLFPFSCIVQLRKEKHKNREPNMLIRVITEVLIFSLGQINKNNDEDRKKWEDLTGPLMQDGPLTMRCPHCSEWIPLQIGSGPKVCTNCGNEIAPVRIDVPLPDTEDVLRRPAPEGRPW